MRNCQAMTSTVSRIARSINCAKWVKSDSTETQSHTYTCTHFVVCRNFLGIQIIVIITISYYAVVAGDTCAVSFLLRKCSNNKKKNRNHSMIIFVWLAVFATKKCQQKQNVALLWQKRTGFALCMYLVLTDDHLSYIFNAWKCAPQ